MEHEIIGHTKKALKVMRNSEKSFWEKTKEILIEVLIIVFAVSFAAFIERAREHAKEQSDAKEFLLGLNDDLKNEMNEIQNSKKAMLDVQKSYTGLEKLKVKDIDSIEKNKKQESFFIPKFNTRPLNGRYDGFKSSGRIQTIENDSLRNHILRLYQEDVPFIDFSENVFNSNQTRLEELMFSNASDKDFKNSDVLRLLVTTKGKLILTFAIDYSQQVVTGYDKMLKQAKVIQAEIDKQYK